MEYIILFILRKTAMNCVMQPANIRTGTFYTVALLSPTEMWDMREEKKKIGLI